MLVNEFAVKLSARCLDEANYTVHAEADTSLAEIIPYLNAVMEQTNYKPDTGSLSFRDGINTYTLQDRDVVVTRLVNPTEAHEKLDWLKDVINETHNKRETLSPCYDAGHKPTLLEMLELLPKKNCGKCGELTCMAFASRLFQNRGRHDECPLLEETPYRSAGMRLAALLA